MSVIVKNMKMPKNCSECRMWSICTCLNDFENYESICYAVDDGDLVRDKNCPLVEIPTPHGRLIDATFEENHYASMLLDPTPDVTEHDKHKARIIIEALRMAGTVIEAEGETE
jgi:hypothetical protein